jgi:hypothetical protein
MKIIQRLIGLLLLLPLGGTRGSTNRKIFVDMTNSPGKDGIDKIKIDRDGNLYVSGPAATTRNSPCGATAPTRGVRRAPKPRRE